MRTNEHELTLQQALALRDAAKAGGAHNMDMAQRKALSNRGLVETRVGGYVHATAKGEEALVSLGLSPARIRFFLLADGEWADRTTLPVRLYKQYRLLMHQNGRLEDGTHVLAERSERHAPELLAGTGARMTRVITGAEPLTVAAIVSDRLVAESEGAAEKFVRAAFEATPNGSPSIVRDFGGVVR